MDFWSITLGVLFVGSVLFLALVGVVRWMLRIDKIVELLEELVKQKNDEETEPE
jgi:hypothetical protein